MEVIRKSLRASLTPKQRRALMRDRFVLLKRRYDLSDEELSGWAENFAALKAAYELKESFFDIYRCQSRQEALMAYAAWRQNIPAELTEAFRPLTTAVENWRNEIFAYFDHRLTNAYTESLNNLIRLINRVGRGYSFEALRAKILFTEGVQKVKRPPFERRGNKEKGKTMVSFVIDVVDPESPQGGNYGAAISTLYLLLEQGRF